NAPDGVRICYATVGEGPPLVKAPNWLSHLVYDWSSPVWRHWWQELSRDHRLVRYDQRCCGLSDWSAEDLSLEAWVRDLEAVVDAVELESFPLLGVSQGGVAAVEYAVRHPERVSHLILYGSYARGRSRRGLTSEEREEGEAIEVLMRQGWGRDNPAYRQIFTSRFIPGATLEQMAWFNDLQRASCSAENAVRIRRSWGELDILDRVTQVRVPTLVLHARDDAAVPFGEGRLLASLIPGAEFVPLEGQNHILLEDEPAWPRFLSEVRQFLGLEPVESPQAGNIIEAARDYPDGLTQREVEVLCLLASGKTDREIAQELTISVGTASTHVRNLLNKTNSANRTEAAAYATAQGLFKR
ncbi:MAG: alpha/beta fold hydrolase, partial [Dehalococcoidia bacterium]